MGKVVKSSAILAAFLVVAFAAWLAWDQRPYEKEDWRAALAKLEQDGHCKRIDEYLNELARHGEVEALNHQLRRTRDPALITKCGYSASSAQSYEDELASMSADKNSKQNGLETGYGTIEDPLEKWTLKHGWHPVLDFALKNLTHPTLVARRTRVWLLCSNPALLDYPKDQVYINRVVYILAENQHALRQTRLERRRRWCAEETYDLQYHLDYHGDLILPGFSRLVSQYHEVRDFLSGHPSPISGIKSQLDAGSRLYFLAGNRYYAPAQKLLAEWLYGKPIVEGAAMRDAALLSAVWAMIARDHGEDVDDLLNNALDQLTSEQKSKVTAIVDCWYQTGGGLTNNEFFAGLFFFKAADDPIWLIELRCNMSNPSSHVRLMQPQ